MSLAPPEFLSQSVIGASDRLRTPSEPPLLFDIISIMSDVHSEREQKAAAMSMSFCWLLMKGGVKGFHRQPDVIR